MSKELLQQAAIHEAGHIIIAHYFGHTINFTTINKAIPGEGKTSIHWGDDQPVINILTKPENIAQRQALRKFDKEYLANLASVFIMILSAGSAAEAAYEIELLGKTSITNLNAGDNDAVAEFIDALSSVGVNLPEDIVLKNYQVVSGLFKRPAFSSAIKGLADKIVSSSNHHLDATALNEYLATVSLN